MFSNFKLVTLYKIGEVHFRFLGTNGFHAKAENKRFTTAGSCCRQNLTRKCAARAARFLSLVKPIESLICGVVVAAAVVILNFLMAVKRSYPQRKIPKDNAERPTPFYVN